LGTLCLLLLAACANESELGSHAAELVEPPSNVFVGAVVPTTGHPGWTDGQADVSPQGSATYRVPLWVPAGRSGIEPQLALEYDHRAGNGVVGHGWVIRGLSSITRCAATAHALGTGQIQASITNTASDALCVDGELLVPDGAEGEFRVGTNGTIRVARLGAAENPRGFLLRQPDGRVVHFGVEADAVVTGTTLTAGGDGVADELGPEVAIGWLMSGQEDRSGNSLSVRYVVTRWGAERHHASEHRPIEIRYTGNRHTSEKGSRVVRFVYDEVEVRPDVALAFQAGMATVLTQRIAEIRMLAPTDPSRPEEASVMRSYRLDYEQSAWTGRSLLTTVTECDGSEVCRSPVRFEYTEPTSGDFSMEGTPFSGRVEPLGGDIDGDGANDFLERSGELTGLTGRVWSRGSDGEWGATPLVADRYCTRFMVADREGDGQVEALCFSSFYGPEDALIWRGSVLWGVFEYDRPGCSTGGGACPGGNLYVRAEDPSAPVELCSERMGNRSFGVADLNGDGRPDPIVGCEASSGERVLRSPGVATYELVHGSHRVGNLVGDGGHDLLVRNEDGKYRAVSIAPDDRGIRPFAFEGFETSLRASDDLAFVDVNGDGLLDAVSMRGDGGPTVRLNVGGARFAAARSAIEGDPIVDFASVDPELVRVGDFNGDGLPDLVVTEWAPSDSCERHRPKLWVLFSNGRTFSSALYAGLGDCTSAPTGTWPASVPRAPTVADIDGDGISELAPGYTRTEDEGGGFAWLRWPKSTPDLLRQVRRSGATIDADFTYGRVGADREACTYPAACASAPLSVVRFVDRTGLAYSHDYAGSRHHAVTKSWLGFSRHTVREEATGRTHVTWFDNRSADQRGEVLGVGLPRLTLAYAPHASGAGRYHASITENLFGTQAVGPARVRTVDRARTRQWEPVALATEGLPVHLPSDCLVLPARFGGDVRPTCAAWLRAPFPTDAPMREGETSYVYSRGIVHWTSSTILGAERTVTSTTWATAPAGCTDFPEGFPGRVDVTSTDLPSGVSHTRSLVYSWNCDGTLASSEREPEGALRLSTRYEREPATGLTTAVIDRDRAGRERRTELQYDEEWIHPRGELDAVGLERGAAIHPGLGVPVWSVDEGGVETALTYDGFGRLRTSRVGTMTRTVRYDEVVGLPMRLVAHVDEGGQPSRSVTVDWLGRVHQRRNETLEGWVYSAVTYDALGREERVEVPHFLFTQATAWVEYGYDILDRVSVVRTSAGATTTIARDRLSATITDPRGHRTTRLHDAAGRVLSVTEAAPDVGGLPTFLTFAYGPFGARRSTRDHRGSEWTDVVDAYGRLTRSVDPDTGTTAFSYDAFGQKVEELDGAGRVRARHAYDELGRTIRSESAADGVTRFVWDTVRPGRLSHATREADGVTTHFRYDAFGRTVQQSQYTPGSSPLALDYAYDADGRISTMVYPYDGTHRPVVRYAYADTADGSLASVTYDGRPIWRTTERDALNRVEREIFGNSVETAIGYDASTTRLQAMTTRRGVSAPLQDLIYGYDAEGNVRRREDRSLTVDRLVDYEYDGLDRLRFARVAGGATSEYRYDDLGNLTYNAGLAQTYAEPGAPHRLSRVGSTPVVHDDRGRMETGLGWSATYTDFGLPRTLTRGSATTTFRYDAFGTRAEKRSSTGVTTYLGGVYQRRVASGVTSHVMDIQADARVVAQVTVTGSSTRIAYLHSDYLGSPTLITDEAGNVAERYAYRPYGGRRRVSSTGAPITTAPPLGRDGFTGHEHDDELGLVNMRGRMYDPVIGRFLTADPLILGPLRRQTYNAYSYVFNNPATMVDPSGYGGDRPDRQGGGGTDDGWGVASAAALGLLGWVIDELSSGDDSTDTATTPPPEPRTREATPPPHASRIATSESDEPLVTVDDVIQTGRAFVAGGIAGLNPLVDGPVRDVLEHAGAPVARDDDLEQHWGYQTARLATSAWASSQAFGAASATAVGTGGAVTAEVAAAPETMGGTLAAVPVTAEAGLVTATALGTVSLVYGVNAIDAATELYTLATRGPNLRWGNPASRPTYGHTFLRHGSRLRPSQLIDRARTEGHQIGQWTDELEAANLIADVARRGPGVYDVAIRSGLGRSFLGDGTQLVADMARVVVRPNGAVSTAFPFSSLHPN
jgi:RHS repeat-associated protein